MTEADRMWASAIAAATAFTQHPVMKAYYRRVAAEQSAKLRAETEAAQRKREAAAAEKARARSYDAYVLNGGADECTRFGIMGGCKPWCPVFERGDCPEHEENVAMFAAKHL